MIKAFKIMNKMKDFTWTWAAIDKIKKSILSCKTERQLETTKRWFQNNYLQYKNEYTKHATGVHELIMELFEAKKRSIRYKEELNNLII